MQYLNDLGRIGLGSRMKRFSDYLISEVNAIYKEAGIQFEASCFPLLSLLEREKELTIREAEKKLGTTHSYISQKAKYLMDEGLITLKDNPEDGRSKIMILSASGKKLIDQARPYWMSMDKAFAELMSPDERFIFQALASLESKFMERPLRDVVRDVHQRPSPPKTKIENYRPEYQDAFSNLNLEWLEKSFVLTEFDHLAFSNPEKMFLKKGGDIFFAVLDGKPVGTAALYPVDDGFELCKMGVDPRYRGNGIGQTLIAEGIRRARKKGAKTLMLLSHSKKLAPAVALYKTMGFKEIPLRTEDRQKYGLDRVDTRMEIAL